MEKSEVSSHEVRVYRALLTGGWKSNRQIAEASGVTLRTVRAHTLKLVRLGIVDQAEVFPGHRYRMSEHAANRNRTYTDRINRAAEVLGIPLETSE